MPVINAAALIDNRVAAIRKAHEEAGIARAELDLSGGIDSAVMAGLLVLALGPENVTLAHTRMSTAGPQTKRAKNLATCLGCRLADGEFTGAFNVIVEEALNSLENAGYDRAEIDARVAADPTILGSIRSTLRAPLGRAYNRLTGGGIRHGTGNECEDRWLRFYQKGGDGEVDSNPIAMLSKGEVYQLAFALGRRIDKENDRDAVAETAFRTIIEAVPSPDLWGTGDGHSDEDEIGDYLDFDAKALGLTWYSYIDLETGEYTKVGLIERVSRFLDTLMVFEHGDRTSGDVLFGETVVWERLLTHGRSTVCMDRLSPLRQDQLFRAVRKAEAATRHKMNPNCPSYGTREELVEAGILTNDLPYPN